jgi:tetratricopeptide (TPR) repeat protein
MRLMNTEPLDKLTAEHAYLFRHALLRDAAYEMQLPSERAHLHAFAFRLIEQAFGGPAPDAAPLDEVPQLKLAPHSTDPVARELALHARAALDHEASGVGREHLGRYARRAAEYAQRKFLNDEAHDLWLTVADLHTGNSRAEALRRAGTIAHNNGNPARAIAAWSGAKEEFRATGNRTMEGVLLHYMALLYCSTGDFVRALHHSEQAVAAARAAGNPGYEGMALGGLAAIYQETGRLAPAEETYLQAIAIFTRTGEQREQGVALGNLALVYHITGRRQLAEETFARALAIHRQIGERLSEGIILATLASSCYLDTEPARAEQTLNEALAILREARATKWEGITLGYRANLFMSTGRLAYAADDFRRAIAAHQESQSRRYEGVHKCDYARCLLAQSRPEDARELWLEGAAILRGIGDAQELEVQRRNMEIACREASVSAFQAPA